MYVHYFETGQGNDANQSAALTSSSESLEPAMTLTFSSSSSSPSELELLATKSSVCCVCCSRSDNLFYLERGSPESPAKCELPPALGLGSGLAADSGLSLFASAIGFSSPANLLACDVFLDSKSPSLALGD